MAVPQRFGILVTWETCKVQFVEICFVFDDREFKEGSLVRLVKSNNCIIEMGCVVLKTPYFGKMDAVDGNPMKFTIAPKSADF